MNLINTAKIQIKLDEPQKALACLQQSRLISKEIHDEVKESYALQGLGSYYLSMHDYKQALENYDLSLKLTQGSDNFNVVTNALFGKAKIDYALGDFINARIDIEAAIKIVESLRGNILSADLRASFFAT